jgi:hypothetical protein
VSNTSDGFAVIKLTVVEKEITTGLCKTERSGDPGMGNYSDATVLKTFGEVPTNLDEL